MFALKYAKLSKITSQTSVATEVGKKTCHKWEMGNLPKFCCSFYEFLYSIFLQFPTQKNVTNKEWINSKFPKNF